MLNRHFEFMTLKEACKIKGNMSGENAIATFDHEDRPSATSSVEFNLHSCYYKDFFLLRIPITINGRLTETQKVDGHPTLVYSKPQNSTDVFNDPIKLSATVTSVLSKCSSIEHMETLHHEKESLYSMKLRSVSSLKQFLSEKEAVQKELLSAIAQTCGVEADKVSVDVELYLVSPNLTRSPPEVCQVVQANYDAIARAWEESQELFDLSKTMFADIVKAVGDHAEFSDLLKELKGVVAWFQLGVHLKIATEDLLIIREDNRGQTERCQLEMLIRWGQLETPTWSKLVSALVKIGRRCLAQELAQKYGLPCPSGLETSDDQMEDQTEISQREQQLMAKEKELEDAKQLQNESDHSEELEGEIVRLQSKVDSLQIEATVLKEQIQLQQDMQYRLTRTVKEESCRLMENKIKEIENLKGKLRKKEEELGAAKRMLCEKEEELARLQEDLKAKSAQVTQLEQETERMRNSLLDLERERDTHISEGIMAREEYRELQLSMSEKDKKEREERKKMVDLQMEMLEVERNREREQENETEKQGLALVAEREKLEEDQRKLAKERKEMEEKLTKEREEMAEDYRTLAKKRVLEDMAEEYRTLLKERVKMAEDHRALAKEREKMAEDHRTLAKKREEMAEDHRTLAKEREEMADDYRKLAKKREEMADDYRKLAEKREEMAEDYRKLAEKREELAEGFMKLAEQKKGVIEDYRKLLVAKQS